MTVVDSSGVYNGKCKLVVQNRNFMLKSDVELCMVDLKIKNLKDMTEFLSAAY